MKKLLLLLPVFMLLQSCGFEIVDDGYVGIKKTNGKISKEVYEAGLHFYAPIVSSIFEMEVREQKWNSDLLAYSADNQEIKATFQVNYRPVASKMAALYVSQGKNYINVILPQRVTAAVKEVLGKHKATNLVDVRAKVNSDTTALIRKRLEGTHVSLVSFEITNFDYDDAFEAAVRAKVVAKERAIEEANKTVQVKEQAAQKVLRANAEATKITVMAKALSKNKDLIQLEAVKKWNGILPTMTMGGALPFINLNPKKL